ncbi:MAG: gfo/Idh/MocA family oxidoreductase [Planctomycetaceae bacterium]|nr:MAG: gfo/Idh/MocA family oxidoreductase [Planctomycetaceae bacterium]
MRPTRAQRRNFLTRSLAISASAAAWGGFHINPAPAIASDSPNEKLNLAAVGATGRAGANIAGCKSQNIVAIADVDANLLDKAGADYPSSKRYRDFRVMLEQESDRIDGVLVGTPDHTHAPAAAMAMRMKKHVYCEKPLTHTVHECRVLSDLAKANSLVTQMGNQIHAGANYRRVVELIRAGAIGPVEETHVWVPTEYSGGKFTSGSPVPAGLDWDLWLGPTVERPYSEGAHPFHWRRFWDFGTGALGDFGCHYMDLVHWALDLRAPTTISARGPEVDPVSPPSWVIVDYDYPARGDQPPVRMTWYDGGKRPEALLGLKDAEGKPLDWRSGQLFIGRDGMLISDYGRHLLLPADKYADFQRPEPTIPDSIGHHAEWIEAVRTGGPTTCNFDYAGALTEAVLLGVVAYRSGEKVHWDADNLRVTNSPAAQALLHKEYRKGWSL